MSMQRKVSPLQRSVWYQETAATNANPSSPPSPIVDSGEVSSGQRLSTNGLLESVERLHTAPVQADASQSSFSISAKTLAYTIALGAICAGAIMLPIVLTNVLKGKATTTTTTTTSSTSSTSSTSTTSTSTSTSTSSSTSTSTSTSQTTATTSTTTTTPMCSITCVNTTTSITSRIAFYSFDSNTNDATGVYPAGGIASPSYVAGYVGSAIYFDAALLQRLSAPSMSLDSRSFTIEFWFWVSNSSSVNYAFFGQMSVQNTGQQSLFIVSAAGTPYMGFFNRDTPGNGKLQDNVWYHGAFVYDSSTDQQLIYIDGILNVQSVAGLGAYLGTSGPVTIGGADIYGSLGVPYLTGAIDHLTVSTRAKSACEILNDATLAAYFPFDGSFADAGPNFLSVASSGASLVSGFVRQALYLSGSNSYFQIIGLTGLGRVNHPFSIALWIYPIVPGVIAHVHTGALGLGWCTPFMGISAAGNIVVQVHSYALAYNIQGPVIQLNTWTHIVQTYSPTNGESLYVNGQRYATWAAATTYDASGGQNFMTIGNALNGSANCYNPGIMTTPYLGMIDEIRIYSRELSASDVCLLAWP